MTASRFLGRRTSQESERTGQMGDEKGDAASTLASPEVHPPFFITLLEPVSRAAQATWPRLRAASAAFCACACGVFLLAIPPGVWALDPGKAVTQYMHDVWQTEQGLPQNTVTAIVQAPDGYLWLGTQEGLVRFDGVRFTVFDTRTTPELGHNFVLCLLADRTEIGRAHV